MNRLILTSFLLLWGTMSLFAQNHKDYQQTSHGVKADINAVSVEIQFFNTQIVRVLKYPAGKMTEKKSMSVIKEPENTHFQIHQQDNVLTLTSSALIVTLNLSTGDVLFNGIDETPLIAEKSASTLFIPKNYETGKTYEVQQTFVIDKQEAIYGLGQHQQGRMNQRGQTVFLKQANMEIAIPVIHSTKGYAVFWDNYSPTTYKDSDEGLSFTSTVGDCIDYYFMYGKNADGVIVCIRELTGQAPMFPLWSYGFWQSRERYTSQDELLNVVKKYRELNIPLDGIVQDWQYWGTDNKDWNAVEFGNPAFPDPKKMMDEVHQMNAHIAISVWPSFGPNTNIFKDLKNKNLLFDFETFPQNNGVKVYDAFNPEARKIFWDYMNKNIFSLGIDSWWLDATEPEHHGEDEVLNQPTYLGGFRNVCNAFPLASVGGVHDHQREVTSGKRVHILTRSAFAGQQRYGAASWSGDVISRWDVLRSQIPAGLNFSLCGIPYWNTDIGGFFSYYVYPEGINDKAFHELYVRWMQFAVFTPMMRSHGTHTPREIFQFGQKGDWAFDTQEKYINLRYSLLPYMYSIAHNITGNAGSMMRALSMDFADDTQVYDIGNVFMFGKSILVAPVTDSMYVSRINGNAVEDFNTVKSQKVYLPKGADWYDFWTGDRINGGQEIDKAAPIDIIPLYIKAGTILPWGSEVQYAEEKQWDNLNLFIFPGANAEFVLYEDENDNYNYEKGVYSTITIKWNDQSGTLIIGKRKGEFPGMLEKRTFNITIIKNSKTINTASQPDKQIVYQGDEVIWKTNPF